MSRQSLIQAEINKPFYVRRRLSEMGFWFVDIPRTSSTSIRLALQQRYGKIFGRPSASSGLAPGLVPPHAPALKVKEQLGSDLWSRLYSFTIVRNPFERVLSLFRFLQANRQFLNISFSDYVRLLDQPGKLDFHGHTLSSWGFISDEQGQQLVSEVFRFEDRASAMPEIARRTGCPELAEGGRKTYETLKNSHYSREYDRSSRLIIERLFADDFDRFGYSWDTD